MSRAAGSARRARRRGLGAERRRRRARPSAPARRPDEARPALRRRPGRQEGRHRRRRRRLRPQLPRAQGPGLQGHRRASRPRPRRCAAAATCATPPIGRPPRRSPRRSCPRVDHHHGAGRRRGQALRLGHHRRDRRGRRGPDRHRARPSQARTSTSRSRRSAPTWCRPSSTPTWSSRSPSRSSPPDAPSDRRRRPDAGRTCGRRARASVVHSARPQSRTSTGRPPGFPRVVPLAAPQASVEEGEAPHGRPTRRARHRAPPAAARAGCRPHNLQAEESLLGAMLLSARRHRRRRRGRHRVDDFYKPAHGHIYDAIPRSTPPGEPADPVTVADELRRAGLLDAIGGPAVLVAAQVVTPAISNAGRYAKIVEEHALLRRLIGVAGEIAEIGYAVPDDVTKAVDQAESMVFEVAERRVTDTMAPIHDLLDDNLDRLEQLYERGRRHHRHAHRLHRPRRAAVGPPAQLAGRRRRPSRHGQDGVRPRHGRPRRHRGPPAGAVLLARDEPASSSPSACSAPRPGSTPRGSATASSAETTGRRSRRAIGPPRRGPDLDRRQPEPHDHGDPGQGPPAQEPDRRPRPDRRRLPPADDAAGPSAENRQVEVSEISRGLKILARELETPGHGPLAALPWPRDARRQAPDARRPARVGLDRAGRRRRDVHLPRRDLQPEAGERGQAEIIVAKHRSGPTGVVQLAFLPQYTRFANMARGFD